MLPPLKNSCPINIFLDAPLPMTSVFAVIWNVTCPGIFTLQITDMADPQGIKITEYPSQLLQINGGPHIILGPCE